MKFITGFFQFPRTYRYSPTNLEWTPALFAEQFHWCYYNHTPGTEDAVQVHLPQTVTLPLPVLVCDAAPAKSWGFCGVSSVPLGPVALVPLEGRGSGAASPTPSSQCYRGYHSTSRHFSRRVPWWLAPRAARRHHQSVPVRDWGRAIISETKNSG